MVLPPFGTPQWLHQHLVRRGLHILNCIALLMHLQEQGINTHWVERAARLLHPNCDRPPCPQHYFYPERSLLVFSLEKETTRETPTSSSSSSTTTAAAFSFLSPLWTTGQERCEVGGGGGRSGGGAPPPPHPGRTERPHTGMANPHLHLLFLVR